MKNEDLCNQTAASVGMLGSQYEVNQSGPLNRPASILGSIWKDVSRR